MSRRTLLLFHIFLFFILFVGNVGVGTIAPTSSSAPTISLTPTLSVVPRLEGLALNLSIFNVTDLYLWVTTIEWNSTILSLTSYSEGPFLKQGGQTTFIVGRVTPGKVEGLTCCLLGSVSGVTGNGTLATFQFNATAIGWTSINITFSDLLDSSLSSMAHYTINSAVDVPQSSLKVTANSPVNILVVSPNGRRVGYDWSTHSVVNEIDGATYTGPGTEPQVITIPDPTYGTYNVTLVGTTSGNYTLTIEYATPTQTTTQTFNGTISQEETQSFSVAISGPSGHDITLLTITISKTVVGQTYEMPIDVAVENQGDFQEDFNVTLFANTTIIGKQTVISIPNGTWTILVFTWNTSGFAKGNYVISAYAEPVPGETDTTDNNYPDGWVVITVPGDLDGDFKVQLADLVILAKAYDSRPGDTRWNPNADIDGNSVVGLSDLVILANHYGQHFP